MVTGTLIRFFFRPKSAAAFWAYAAAAINTPMIEATHFAVGSARPICASRVSEAASIRPTNAHTAPTVRPTFSQLESRLRALRSRDAALPPATNHNVHAAARIATIASAMRAAGVVRPGGHPMFHSATPKTTATTAWEARTFARGLAPHTSQYATPAGIAHSRNAAAAIGKAGLRKVGGTHAGIPPCTAASTRARSSPRKEAMKTKARVSWTAIQVRKRMATASRASPEPFGDR